MDDEINQITAQRRRRINKMKKAIMVSVLLLIIIPIVLCIILMVRVCSLENKLNELFEAKKQGKLMTTVNETQSSNDGDEVLEETAADETENKVYLKKPGYGRTVCLTFDDGPSQNTEEILDILDKYNVKATFFVIGGTDEAARERYKEIVDRGHTIGLHSYSHDYKNLYSSIDGFAEEVSKIHDAVYDATGVDTRLFRFPWGSGNTLAKKVDIQDCIDYLNENGYTYFDWNVSSGDATKEEQTAEALMKNIENDLYKFDTAVILMHDATYKNTTVKMLPMLLEKLIDEGFEIKSIDESVEKVQQIKDNT